MVSDTFTNKSCYRLTLVAFVFIPLSFSSSFFGMNIQQLGTGSIHLGYFFLLAVLAGGLAYTLTATVKPVEAAWLRARQRFAAREWQDEIAVNSVTKSDIIWGYARRHSRVTRTIYEYWKADA